MANGEQTTGRTPSVAIARIASRIPVDASLAVLDVFGIVVAYTGLLLLRFDLKVPDSYWERFGAFLAVAVVVHLVANVGWRTYGHIWEHASIDEARRLFMSGLTAWVVLVVVDAVPAFRIPLSVVMVGPLVATIFMGATRFQSRLFAFRSHEEGSGLRVVVVGAGAGGGAAVREMRRDHQLGMSPVAVLDDDPRTQGRSINGVPIAGGIDDLARVVHERDVHQVLLAIGDPSPALAARVMDGAAAAGVPVKVAPRLADVVHGQATLRDVRELRIEDLLGRAQVDLDLQSVRTLLRGRRVLVTGGGGSIGSEIARQVAELHPAALVILDHDETHLHDAAQALPASAHQVLADIRDRDLVERVFTSFRPEVVFHAAAHKHVPLLESHACEAVRTNVLGTVNVVDAAVRAGTDRVVFISTDKAACPVSVMGASKWLAEQLAIQRVPSSRFCAVRFGNVMGSRGSVIPTFQRQIAAGGPVTVTDPRMTRYFMSTKEAVSLVLNAAASDGTGILMLEMGEPVNILELAERMIRLSGRAVDDIGIEFTGPRPGERLEEEMSGPLEELAETGLTGIVSVRPVAVAPEQLEQVLDALVEAADRRDDVAAATLLRGAVAVADVAARDQSDGAPFPRP